MINIVTYGIGERAKILSSFFKENNRVEIVCPGPLVADAVRFELQHMISSEHVIDIDVITFSKLLKNRLSDISKEYKLVRKSDLLLIMSSIWKRLVPDGSYSSYISSFDLFTELRGFSTDLNLVEDALLSVDESSREVITTYYKVMELLEYIDEYEACSIIAKDSSTTGDQKIHYVFVGFSFMTGVQVDMIKTVANGIRVTTLLPAALLDEVKMTDWIAWLDSSEQARPSKKQLSSIEEIQIVNYPKGRTGESIKLFLTSLDVGKGSINFVACEKDMHQEFPLAIPFNNLHFRSSVDTFKVVVDNVFLVIINKIFQYLEQTNKGYFQIPVEKCLDIIKTVLNKELRKVENSSGMSVKVILLIYNKVEMWSETSEQNLVLSSFELDVIQQIVSLDTPRIFATPALRDFRGMVGGLNIIPYISSDDFALMVVNSETGDISGAEGAYNQEMEEFLTTVGPIKRRRFDFLFLKDDILSFLSSPNHYLLFEEGLLQRCTGWSEIFDEVGIKEIVIKEANHQNKSKGYLDMKIIRNNLSYSSNTLTASKIQKYIECPRKFYFSYIDNLEHRLNSQTILFPYQLGEIQHSAIELTFKSVKKDPLNSSRELFYKYLLENKIELSSLNKKRYLSETIYNVSKGVTFIKELMCSYQLNNVEFEVEIDNKKDDYHFKGRVDCIISGPDKFVIIDFKRSSSSVPTVKSVCEFNSIQLWYYLSHFKIEKELLLSGYICLKSIGDSLLIIDEGAEDSYFCDKYKIKAIVRCKLSDEIGRYLKVEGGIVNSIKNDLNFKSIPMNTESCKYCQVKNFCERN